MVFIFFYFFKKYISLKKNIKLMFFIFFNNFNIIKKLFNIFSSIRYINKLSISTAPKHILCNN
jgi:hypothetical protein